MDSKLKILLVEDSEMDADLLIRFLKKVGIEPSFSRVWNKTTFIKSLKENNYDLIIADHTLPQFSGIEAFRITKKENKNIPFILVTGTVTEKILTEYAKEGVDDYILKDNLLRLPSAIEHVISKKKIELLLKKLKIAYKDINDSINYAKRIQNAMLPDVNLLKESFPDSFIFFKPKDILSGDFYWFKNDENIFLFAAADCTGHGIPGALLSMICIEEINNAVLKTKEPFEILKQLNENIEIALSQSTIYENSMDGMDIAFCSIDKESRILKFAGANRPLWVIRKGRTEIVEIKGSKKEIGGLTTILNVNFDRHEIKLEKGDTLYIFSDGYVDQFGGENKKKFKKRGFKELLLNIQDKTMLEQKKYLNIFIDNWKSGTEQVDDILIIGIRQ